jgi:Alpha-L-arabinofuranosidase B, catalytic
MNHEHIPILMRPKRARAASAIIAGLMAGSLVGLRATNSQTIKQRPCDIYAAESTPCVAAHSTVRSLYAKYTGALYQVKRASDDATQNIGATTMARFISQAMATARILGTPRRFGATTLASSSARLGRHRTGIAHKLEKTCLRRLHEASAEI